MTGDVDDLALFLEIVDSGSITAGARHRNLSLPAASARISALERKHGVQLFYRSRRGTSPTAGGKLLAELARRVLAESRELDRHMAAHSQGSRHEIRMASNNSAMDTLTEFLASALVRFPHTTMIFNEMSSTEAISQVATGAVHIAVVSEPPQTGTCQVRELWADPLVVVGPDTIRTGKADHLNLKEVLRGQLIGLTEGNPLQDLIDHKAFGLGIATSYRVRLPSLSAVCAVASTGAGSAIVPLGTARRAGIPASAITPLGEPWAQRQALLVALDFNALSQPVTTFAEALMRYRTEVIE